MAMRILITGAGGMLGQDVVDAAHNAGLATIPVGHAELDITDADAVAATVMAAQPDVVVNCAAWTDVDGAEAGEAAARAVNGSGAGDVASAASAVGAHTIHISSDYVFDGAKREPYVESDPTGPLSSYGRSKLAGEEAVAQRAAGRHTIVRSSWLFGVHGRCFPATILRLAAERDELTVVDDQIGCPTFTGHLAAAVIELCRTQPSGILHVAGGGACSWFDFARAILDRAGIETTLKPGTTAEQDRPAPRPAYSVLGSERRLEVPALPPWQRGLEEYLRIGVPS